MPRTGKKGAGKNTLGQRTSDVTLDDFANCKVSAGRLRKSTSNSFIREVKKCSSFEEVLRTQEEEQGEEANEDDNLSSSSSSTQVKPKVKGKCVKSIEGYGSTVHFVGQDYPLDLWFLLSEYINPEDVHIFASLCKSALYVVRTYKFWITLYKRYYTFSAPLPENLLPQNIQRPRFLRLSVIRALHYLYPPFAKRVSTTRSVDQQAYHLRQLCCVALWHSCVDNKFTFFIKFSAPTRTSLIGQSHHPSRFSMHRRKPHPDGFSSGCKNTEEGTWLADVIESWEGISVDNITADDQHRLCDVNANPEAGCCILKLSCRHYTSVPPSVLGHWLADIKVTLTTDMRCYRVQLSFGAQSYQCSPVRRVNRELSSPRGRFEVIEFSPVESVNVFHWWHPQYPLS